MLEKQRMPSDLVAVLSFTLLFIVSITIPQLSDSPLRILFGAIFVLFLPGYVLVAALFPKKEDMVPLYRFALSFVISIALVSLTGVALSHLPWKLRLAPVIFTIIIFIVILTIIAAIERIKTPPEIRLDFSFSQLIDYLGVKEAYRNSRPYLILLMVSVLLSTGVIYYAVTHPQPRESFTEFYVLDTNMRVENYEKTLVSNQKALATVIVVNHEYSDVNYILNVRMEWGNISNSIFKKEFTLKHNETLKEGISYSVSEPGEYELKFLLFRDEITKRPYRRLHLWLKV